MQTDLIGESIAVAGKSLRSCTKTEGSSLFGIILAYFRFFFGGSYTKLILPPEKESKIDQKNPKIDGTSVLVQLLRDCAPKKESKSCDGNFGMTDS